MGLWQAAGGKHPHHRAFLSRPNRHQHQNEGLSSSLTRPRPSFQQLPSPSISWGGEQNWARPAAGGSCPVAPRSPKAIGGSDVRLSHAFPIVSAGTCQAIRSSHTFACVPIWNQGCGPARQVIRLPRLGAAFPPRQQAVGATRATLPPWGQRRPVSAAHMEPATTYPGSHSTRGFSVVVLRMAGSFRLKILIRPFPLF